MTWGYSEKSIQKDSQPVAVLLRNGMMFIS